MAAATAAYTLGESPIALIVGLACTGAMAGDHAGYYLGRLIGPAFHERGFIARYRKPLQRGEQIIRDHGTLAIFIGRFVPAIRSLLPALLGISRFDRLRYSLYDGMACLLWALALAAIVFGIDVFL